MSDGKTRSVLMLDDEKSLRDALVPMFKDYEIDLYPVATLAEARAILDQRPIDWAIIDIQMPVSPEDREQAQIWDFGRTYGLKAIKEIRSLRPDLNILAFTIITNKEIHDCIREYGKSPGKGKIDILVKPVYFDSILSKVRTR